MKSKKERAFYAQLCLVVAYFCGKILAPAALASSDTTFLGVMGLLASYHITQGAIDFKHGERREPAGKV